MTRDPATIAIFRKEGVKFHSYAEVLREKRKDSLSRARLSQ